MAGTDPVLADPNPLYLEWDSCIFKQSVTKLDLSAPKIPGCRVDINKEDLLYLSVDIEDAYAGSHAMTTLDYLTQSRSSTILVDVQVKLETPCILPFHDFRDFDESITLEKARKEHDLIRFAWDFPHSRFYRDPRLKLYCGLVYTRWIESMLDYSYVAVAPGGAVAGFISLKGNNIELLTVRENYRNRGIGRALIKHALSRSTEVVEKFTVHTQAANVEAMSLYQKYGFKVTKMKLRYHSWK